MRTEGFCRYYFYMPLEYFFQKKGQFHETIKCFPTWFKFHQHINITI